MAMIAHHAGVSKPLLFHHFGTKEKLYKACLAFIEAKLKTLLSEDHTNTPFIDRVEAMGFAKLTLEKKYPGIFKFYSIHLNTLPKIPPNPMTKTDKQLLKKGVAADSLWKLLYYLSLGFQSSITQQDQSEEIFIEFQNIFSLIKSFMFNSKEA